MLKIGITGTIGSGKSLISNVFKYFNIPVYNSDERAKILMTSKIEIIDKLKEIIGEEAYINKELNKNLLSNYIFSSEKNRLLINSIVHPIVLQDFLKYSQKIETKILCLESALIFEAKLDSYLDKIILVETPIELQIKYLKNRSEIPRNKAINIINLQNKQFINKKIDIIINDNNKSIIEQILSIIKI